MERHYSKRSPRPKEREEGKTGSEVKVTPSPPDMAEIRKLRPRDKQGVIHGKEGEPKGVEIIKKKKALHIVQREKIKALPQRKREKRDEQELEP